MSDVQPGSGRMSTRIPGSAQSADVRSVARFPDAIHVVLSSISNRNRSTLAHTLVSVHSSDKTGSHSAVPVRRQPSGRETHPADRSKIWRGSNKAATTAVRRRGILEKRHPHPFEMRRPYWPLWVCGRLPPKNSRNPMHTAAPGYPTNGWCTYDVRAIQSTGAQHGRPHFACLCGPYNAAHSRDTPQGIRASVPKAAQMSLVSLCLRCPTLSRPASVIEQQYESVENIWQCPGDLMCESRYDTSMKQV